MNPFSSIKTSVGALLKRESMQQLGFIYSSRMTSAVLRFFASILIANALGSERLGVLTIASVIMGVSSKVIEMGLTTTMIRKLSLCVAEQDDEGAVGIFRRIFAVRMTVSMIFLVASWFLAPLVAWRVYQNPTLVLPLRIAGAGAVLFNIDYHTEGTLRALEKFRALAIIQAFSHVVRFILILVFARMALLDVENTLLINIAQLLIAFAIASLVIPRSFYRVGRAAPYPLRDVFAYSGWIYLFNIMFMLFDRLDVLMLGYFKADAQVGIYAVAFTMIKPFELIPESFNTVFLPKVSKYTRKHQIFRFFRDTLKVTGLIAVLGILLILAAEPLIDFFYKDEFLPAVRLFQILVGAFILLTMVNPLSLVGHTLNKPQIFVIMAAINLALNFGGNMIFIPPYGAVGAAVVTLVSRVLGSLLGFLVLLRYLRRWDEGRS